MAKTAPGPGLRARLRAHVVGRSTPEFFVLLASVATLAVLGLVMTFSASFVQAARDLGDAFGIFQRQLAFLLIGAPLAAVAALTDYRRWRPLAWPLLLLALALAALVLVPSVGVEAHGARRWLAFGPVRFQPSEVVKLAVALWTATVLAGRWTRVRRGDLHALLMPVVPVVLLAAGLVLTGPDLETAVLIGFIGGVALYVAGLPLRIIAVGLGGTVAAAGLAIATTPFRRARMEAWLDPMEHAGTFGYQSLQGFISLGSGGVFGRGLGQGRGQWLYVPNAHTDFIYAIIGEELGLLGALLVLLLFSAVAVAGLRAARRAPDPFGRLLAVTVTGWVLAQAVMNMGSVVGVLPVTGVTLPLVSFGGTSLVVTLVGLGLVMSVARVGRRPRQADDATTASAGNR